MKNILITLTIVFLSACNHVNYKNATPSNSQYSAISIRPKEKSVTKDINKKDSKDKKLAIDSSKLLIGIWTGVGEDNAAFDLKTSKIYYPDNNKTFKYKIDRDSIKIFYEDGSESFRFSFSGIDTLILTGIDGPSKFYKFKK